MWAGAEEKGGTFQVSGMSTMTNVHKVEFQMERVEKYRNSPYFLSTKERNNYLLRWDGVI